MKGKADSSLHDQEKHGDNKFEENIDNVIQKMGEISVDNEERRSHEPSKDADQTDEKIRDLTANVLKLNISANAVENVKIMQKRGPTGGIPIFSKISNIANKVIPMEPLGNYVETQNYGNIKQHVPQKKGARSHDDEEDLPAHKYFNPGNMNIAFVQPSGGYMNNLGQTKPAMMNPNLRHEYQFGVDPVQQSMATSQMTITGPMPGGELTVTSPVSNMPPPFSSSLVDDFLDEISAENVSNPVTLPEEHSPFPEPATSPSGSTYTSPPSVDSGCGRSPMHDSAALPGMSPPKYVGINSPANTSGYGSPEMLKLEDSEEFLDPDRLDDLELAYEVIDILKKDEDKQKEKDRKTIDMKSLSAQEIAPSPTFSGDTTREQPVNGSHVMPNQMGGDRCKPVCLAPQTTLSPAANSAGNFAPTTSSGPQQIIILSPAQAQPQILVLQQGPSNTQAKKNPPRQQLRKILPKMPQTSSSAGNNSGNITNTNTTPSIKSEVTMTSKMAVPSGNRNKRMELTNSAQDKLLTMARNSIAATELEHLTKCDKDGDMSLHIAVCKSDKETVLAILERLKQEGVGHLVDKENNRRQTPLYLAVYRNQPVMVQMLIRFQADVNVLAQEKKSTEVKAAIHVAASNGGDYLMTLEILVSDKNISINIVNSRGQTALHCAILSHGKQKRRSQEKINSVSIIKALIKAGADPSAQDKKSGETPLMYAIKKCNLDLVEAILTSVDPSKVRNVVKTQAFDGSSCLRIAEGLRTSYQTQAWNKLWDRLNSAASGSPH